MYWLSAITCKKHNRHVYQMKNGLHLYNTYSLTLKAIYIT